MERRGPVVCLLTCLALATFAPASPPPPVSVERLLSDGYPLEVSISFHAALLHWLDSLAALTGPGMTAGKTIEAHRIDYRRANGEPDEQAVRVLRGFRDARQELAARAKTESDALTVAFFQATSLDEALQSTRELLEGKQADAVAAAVDYFAPRYRPIWRGGRAGSAFVARSADDERRDSLTRFLINVARFYGVAPDRAPPPRLILAPVADGHGTHAQAIGRFLLLEIRPWEGLMDEVAPIVHENAHFLFSRMDSADRQALERIASESGASGPRAWFLLEEALPTAIAQGVADRKFREGWSMDRRWYHTDEVDAYAKRIFPLVKRTLGSGGSFDEVFLRRALALFDG